MRRLNWPYGNSDAASPQYHHWMNATAAAALLAPPAAQVRQVQKYLQAHNLRVVSTDANGLYVRAQGSVADVQDAMHVAIHEFKSHGRIFRSNTADPAIDGPAGSVVAAIGGLSERHMHTYSVRALDPDTGHPFAPVPVASGPAGFFFSAQCFRAPEQQSFTTNGGLPSASYFGNRYGADIANQALGTLPPCGYQPSDVQAAYGLSALYASGLDGSGQTIVIIDAIGSPTIAADAEVFSQVYGLPDLTPANFQVYYPGGAPPAADPGWATETSLDVEWAHSIAPNARIALVIAPTPSDSDLQTAILFAIQHHLGNVISNSYGEAESDSPASLLGQYNQLARYAAARGISVNFSSGDDGDSNPSGVTAGLVLPGVSAPGCAVGDRGRRHEPLLSMRAGTLRSRRPGATTSRSSPGRSARAIRRLRSCAKRGFPDLGAAAARAAPREARFPGPAARARPSRATTCRGSRPVHRRRVVLRWHESGFGAPPGTGPRSARSAARVSHARCSRSSGRLRARRRADAAMMGWSRQRACCMDWRAAH